MCMNMVIMHRVTLRWHAQCTQQTHIIVNTRMIRFPHWSYLLNAHYINLNWYYTLCGGDSYGQQTADNVWRAWVSFLILQCLLLLLLLILRTVGNWMAMRPFRWADWLFKVALCTSSNAFNAACRLSLIHNRHRCGLILCVFRCCCTLRHCRRNNNKWKVHRWGTHSNTHALKMYIMNL